MSELQPANTMSPAQNKPPGQQLFERILSERGYEFAPIECGQEQTPDYKVWSGSDVVICEVKDFGEDELAVRQNQFLAEGQSFVTSFDPVKRLRRRIAKAAEQLNQYPGNACAAVLFSQQAIPYADDFICKQNLPTLFPNFPILSGVLVIETVKPQSSGKSLLEYSSLREAAEQSVQELNQPWQRRARVYVNMRAGQSFPPTLFCLQPDVRTDLR